MGHKIKIKSKHTTLTVWLPTSETGPLLSTSDVSANDDLRVSPWEVAAIPLSMQEVMGILSMCMGKDMLKPFVIIGADVKYWINVLKLASFQVARQQYLPDLVETGDAYAAIWSPILSDDMAQRLHTLERRMPLVARALTTSNQTLPDSSPAGILQRMVAHNTGSYRTHRRLRP